jgi:phosphatidylglycerol:prolipoprotein diacylglycerol transferase
MMPIIDFGAIHMPSYFLVISISLSILLLYLSFRVDRFAKDRKIAFDLAIVIMFAGFIGGRLLHVFFEEWDYYQQDPGRILEFWKGGFVYYGGVIGAFIAGPLYLKWKKQSFLEWADFFAPLFSLSHALGRIGCLLSGCCYGAYCTLPWAMDGRHPTVLYLIGGELLTFCILMIYERNKSLPKGHLFAKWILLHSIIRLNVEYFRDDFRGTFFNVPLFGHISISQVISLILIVGVFVFYGLSYRKRKTSAS